MFQHLDFLVIGAQKCATSWLYYCLKDHHQLHLPADKRDREYLGGDVYEAKGASWYFSRLESVRDHQKVGDVSVEYFFDPRAPAVVHQYAPEVKLVVSLRDPIERAMSAYFWYVRRGSIPNLSIEDGLSMVIDSGFDCQNSPAGKYYNDILARGFYDVQLERYLQYFRLDQLLVVLYDNIRREPLEVIRKIYAFVDVDIDFRPSRLEKMPKVNTYLLSLLHLEHFASKSRLMAKFVDITNQWLYRRGIGKEKPLISEHLYKKIRDVYEPHVKRTKRIIESIPKEQQPTSIGLMDYWMMGQRR